MDPTAQALIEAVAAQVRGREVVLTGGAVRGLAGQVAGLRQLGASRVLVLGIGDGTGSLPEDAEWITLDPPPAPDLFSLLHEQERLLSQLPDDAHLALDRFDPGRRAVVLAGSWTCLTEVAGRRVLGPRPASWAALEDKTTLAPLLASAGVTSVPSVVVEASQPALRAAAEAFDEGRGTVWSGDASQGVNGGGDLVRWIRAGYQDASGATALFRERCERVRVATFLPGVPCSIHGFVFADGTAVLRPVEVISLSQPGGRIRSAGNSTWWDPNDDHRHAMRNAARSIGEHLGSRHGYRGAFGIDGVITETGFVAIELNPRLAAGFQVLGVAVPTLPLALVDTALRDGVLSTGAADLERTIVAAADATRLGRGYTAWAGAHALAMAHHPVDYDGTACHTAADPDDPDAVITTGPSPGGAFVLVEPTLHNSRLGEQLAPLVAAGFRFADANLGSRIGPVQPFVPAPIWS